jgi:hypothetical protein
LRISPIAPPGSLLKGAEGKKRKGHRDKGQVDAHPEDPKYLALLRRCPCLSCDNDPAKVAAHVRMTRVGKPITGAGLKPGDRWALPLCAGCHTDNPKAQHKVGEVLFWQHLGIDPLPLCQRLHRAAPDVQAMRTIVFQAREGRK